MSRAPLSGTVRRCTAADTQSIFQVINDGANAYRGTIPADCWHEPYMPLVELQGEIAAGVGFFGYEDGGALLGVMGIQDVKDVTLIRHAYVATHAQRRGIGAVLLRQLCALTSRPMLIGTWAAATWAIGFYERHGFRVVDSSEKNRLLKIYWSVPDRQIETSVVLVDARWDTHRAVAPIA